MVDELSIARLVIDFRYQAFAFSINKHDSMLRAFRDLGPYRRFADQLGISITDNGSVQ